MEDNSSTYAQIAVTEIYNTTINISLTTPTHTSSESVTNWWLIAQYYWLFGAGALGTFLNGFLLIAIPSQKQTRTHANAYVAHGCFLDMIRALLCFPFALSLYNPEIAELCAKIGPTYVVTHACSLTNLIAVVVAQAYVFHNHIALDEDRGDNDDEDEEESDDDDGLCGQRGGTGMGWCIAFGLVMVYIASLTIHLGPTLIGGEFSYSKDIGNCLFEYGKIQNYLVHAIWMAVCTLTLAAALSYASAFYCRLRRNETFGSLALLGRTLMPRAGVRAGSLRKKGRDGKKGTVDDGTVILKVIPRLRRRVAIAIATAIVYIICWYPLLAYAVIDRHYTLDKRPYTVFIVAAWTQPAITPALYLLFDRTLSFCAILRGAVNGLKKCSCCNCCKRKSRISQRGHKERNRRQSSKTGSHQPLTRESTRSNSFYEKVGNRLHGDITMPTSISAATKLTMVSFDREETPVSLSVLEGSTSQRPSTPRDNMSSRLSALTAITLNNLNDSRIMAERSSPTGRIPSTWSSGTGSLKNRTAAAMSGHVDVFLAPNGSMRTSQGVGMSATIEESAPFIPSKESLEVCFKFSKDTPPLLADSDDNN